MNKTGIGYWVGFLLVSLAAFGAEAQAQAKSGLTLAANGQSEYQIAVAEQGLEADISNRLAQAACLMQAAFKANGCEVPVVPERRRDPAKPCIFLGDTEKARASGIAVKELAEWGYALKTVGRDVIIAGNDGLLKISVNPAEAKWEDRSAGRVRMGTVKGVTDFLRQYMGTRFLYPTGDPDKTAKRGEPPNRTDDTGIEFLKAPAFVVPSDMDVRRTPALVFNACYPLRESFYDIANNLFPQTGVRPGAHSHPDAIPADTYRETHPEYFALVKGRRCCEVKDWTGHWSQQYCLSNPEAQELIYKHLLKWLDSGYECVGLGQADGFVPCECEACANLYATGGDWGEKLWVLHRRLAARLLKDRPGKKVMILAYSHTKNPPKSFTSFPANVVIQLCATNDADFEQWRRLEVPGGFTAYVYNWGPYHPCGGYTPKRTPTYVEAQVRRFFRNHVRGVYRDGFGELFGLEGPVYYVYGRLFEDPENAQAKEVLEEFYAAAFGKASAPMRSFYEKLYRRIAPYSDQIGVGCPEWSYTDTEGRNRKYLEDGFQMLGYLYAPEVVTALDGDLRRAEKAADSDKARRRLALVRMEFDYVRNMAAIVHLYNAYQIRPDGASRARLIEAIDARNVQLDALYDARGRMKPVSGWPEMVPFRGIPRPSLALQTDQYLSRFKDSPLNWDTQALRAAPLPVANSPTNSVPAGIDPP